MNEVSILKGKIHRLAGKGHNIICKNGLIWITQDGDARDVVLSADESIIVTTEGLTLINAVEKSTIALSRGVCGSDGREMVKFDGQPGEQRTPNSPTNVVFEMS